MIRIITLLSLLLTAGSGSAAGLYKWVEADGSITFSPNPPPAGVEFERIGAETDQTVKEISPAAKAESTPKKPATAPSRLSYAPDDGNPTQGIVKAQPKVAAASEAPSAASTEANELTPITVAASKQSRCDDLKKRVISLERRLKVRLSPADMDNTVVHMARYQRSYNQHCLR